MTVEADLFSRLTGFAGVAALVGQKVYPVTLPQGIHYPAISYFRVSSTRPSAMGRDIGIVRARFQVDVWAFDFDSSKAVAEQVRLALQRYSGTNSIEIIEIFFLNEADTFEENTRTYHQALDFEVNYRE
jgi:hypothetical protein